MKRIIYALSLILPVLVYAAADPLSAEMKKSTIESLLSAMNENYVSPETAKKAETLVRDHVKKGTYEKVEDGPAFAALLTDHLNSVCKDAHLRVQYSEKPLPKRENRREPSAQEIEQQKRFVKLTNAGFEKVQRLAGNVGYIEFYGFMEPDSAKRPIQAAMEFVADCDALIFDIRRNGGGHPETVKILCSYLFGDEPVHLNDIHFRDQGKKEFWTDPNVPGRKFLDKPVYVVTSKRTGSGAEEFAYNLKNLKRATLIGESTWGGANPGGVVRLNDHFSVFVPSGRAENPITKTNWEGTGVEPDIKIPQEDALAEAHKLALQKLLAGATSEPDKQRLQNALNEIAKG